MSDHVYTVILFGVLCVFAALTIGFAIYLMWLPKPRRRR